MPDFVVPIQIPITVGICTRHRCQYDPKSQAGHFNPLRWTLSGLASQRCVRISKLIVIEQREESHSCVPCLLEEFRHIWDYQHQLVDGHRALAEMRNLILQSSDTQWVYFIDDDAVPLSEFTLALNIRFSLAVLHQLPNLAVVQPPVYRRDDAFSAWELCDQLVSLVRLFNLASRWPYWQTRRTKTWLSTLYYLFWLLEGNCWLLWRLSH